MILLPNDCTASEPTVFPKNWESGGRALLNTNWRIQYYFRDPSFKELYPYGKLIVVKGMNHLKTLTERREATRELLDNELYMLKVEGFNPITKSYHGPDQEEAIGIHPNTGFAAAIEAAFNELDLAPKTIKDIEIIKKYFVEAIKELRYDSIKVSDIRRPHVRAILDLQSKNNGYSNKRYNKARSYIMMLFKELLNRDAIEFNPVSAIPKKRVTKKLRSVLTNDELKDIKKHLRENYYSFYRYMEIFFHSGSRSSELMRLKRKDINLDDQTFKVTVKKGRHYSEELRAINKNVLELWKEICKGAKKEDYIFSLDLKPGPVSVDPWQISKRWREHVKLKLNVEADFYSLKHLHTTKIVEAYGGALAASVNGHKSEAMNNQHYDVNRKKRMLEEAKNIDVDL